MSLPEAGIAELLQEEYGIRALSVSPAKRVFYGETWRAEASERCYFVKSVSSPSHKPVYARSFSVLEFLEGQGISYVSRAVKTLRGGPYTMYDGAVVGVFDWIEGENLQNERTKLEEYRMLCGVYTVSRGGLDVPAEDFSAASAAMFFARLEELRAAGENTFAAGALEIFKKNLSKIEARANRLAEFSRRCRADLSHFYITHGDAGGNVLVRGDEFFLVDWDGAAFAPPERDAWFCLHWDWAARAFDKALARAGVGYALREERLAYYCYRSFFEYMINYLAAFFDSEGERDIRGELAGYFDCWIEENLRFADTI